MNLLGQVSGLRTRLRDPRLGVAVLVVAALAAGQALTTAFPQERDSTPLVRAGVVGQPLTLRYGVVEVGPVQGSTRTVDRSLSTPVVVESPGVLLLVPLRFTPRGRPEQLSSVTLRDTRGRTFRAGSSDDRVRYNPPQGQPGIPMSTPAVFEVPVDAVAGLHLLAALDGGDPRGDDLADVDLGLTEADAAAFSAQDEPLDVPSNSGGTS